MDKAKNCKNSFYFLQYFFFKGASVVGVFLVVSGGIALFFADISQEGIKYLVLCSGGFVLLASSSYFEFHNMNKKEKRFPIRVSRVRNEIN